MSPLPTFLGKANRPIEAGETFQIYVAPSGDLLSESVDFTQLNQWLREQRAKATQTETRP